jgi:tetrahydromethanopterin S-methyltransferase subunit B
MIVDETRLDRFEQKLDKLSEAVAAIARIDEKIYFASQRADRLEAALDASNKRLDTLALQMTTMLAAGKITDKGFWLVIGAVISGVFAYYFGI